MAIDWTIPQINLHLCDRCGNCVDQCPANAVDMGTVGPVIARPEDCTYCTECEAFCPRGAITCPFEIVWGLEAHTGPSQ
jgi:NAD-dependent dihydropyrimidine dehydrogenase PreA subunit